MHLRKKCENCKNTYIVNYKISKKRLDKRRYCRYSCYVIHHWNPVKIKKIGEKIDRLLGKCDGETDIEKRQGYLNQADAYAMEILRIRQK